MGFSSIQRKPDIYAIISDNFTFLFSNRDFVQASAVAMAFLAASPVSRGLNSSSGCAPCMIPLKYYISSYIIPCSHIGGFFPGRPYIMAPSISVPW